MKLVLLFSLGYKFKLVYIDFINLRRQKLFENSERQEIKRMIQKKYLGNKTDHFISQLQSKYNPKQYDSKRIKRIHLAQDSHKTKQQDKNSDQIKIPVKMHKFNEDTRKNQRQLTQQTHQFMKMVQSMSHSAYDQDKFVINPVGKKRAINNQNNENNERNNNFERPPFALQLDTQFSTPLIPQKFEIQEIYNVLPFKKNSIQIQPIVFSDPKFQFYVMNPQVQKSRNLTMKMFNISTQQGLQSQFREQIKKIMYYQQYFDYLNFIHDNQVHIVNDAPVQLNIKKKPKYPQYVNAISCNNQELLSGSDDDDEMFSHKQVEISNFQTYHRIFECNQQELAKPFQSMYFPNTESFIDFKQLRQVQFKNLKIYAKDKIINTDVHYIIYSQKIYLINIQEQISLLIKIANQNKQTYLMHKIYTDMINKVDEYLRLICGYTKSTILKKYNIGEPYHKILEFLKKSMIYEKQYKYEDIIRKDVLVKFPVLQLWYQLPDKIYGYSRETIHQKLYELIRTLVHYQAKIKEQEQYEGLKERKYGRKYEPTGKKTIKKQQNK